MIALDTNVLVYAHREESPFHTRARQILTQLAESPAPWAIPWPCLHEFLAIVTHRKIFKIPSRLEDAWEFLDALMASPSLWLLSERENYGAALRELLISGQISGPKVHDARIAALCLEHAVTALWTADRDFTRFGNLRTLNPLLVS